MSLNIYHKDTDSLELVSGRVADQYSKAETDSKITDAITPITTELSKVKTSGQYVLLGSALAPKQINTWVNIKFNEPISNFYTLQINWGNNWGSVRPITIGVGLSGIYICQEAYRIEHVSSTEMRFKALGRWNSTTSTEEVVATSLVGHANNDDYIKVYGVSRK